MKIIDIILFSNKCELYFDNEQSAVIYKFGNSLYSTSTQDNLYKPLLGDVKKDIERLGFTEQFKALWV